MKFLSILLPALLLTGSSFAQGILTISKPDIELKNLPADDKPVTVSYAIKNTGNQPVIISRITPFSTNLKADWKKEPLAPNQSSEIQITFQPTQIQETFNYKIMVFSNARNNRAELKISGNIVDNPAKPTLLYKYDMSGIKFKSTAVNFGQIYTWQVRTDTVTYYNTTSAPVTLKAMYQPQHIRTEFIPAQVAPGQKGSLLITVDAPKKNDYGYFYESLILSVNDSKDYKNRLSITANLVEDFSKLSKKDLEKAPVATFDKKETGFGEIKPGEKATCDFTLTNTGKSTLFIRKTKASCGCTAVTLGNNALEPGASTQIRAIFDSKGKTGRQYKSVTVITNDPRTPETILTLQGSIK